jgi:hypothetical protein
LRKDFKNSCARILELFLFLKILFFENFFILFCPFFFENFYLKKFFLKIFPRFPQKLILLPQCGSQISKHFQALHLINKKNKWTITDKNHRRVFKTASVVLF